MRFKPLTNLKHLVHQFGFLLMSRYEALLQFLKAHAIRVSDCNPCDCGCECEHALVPLNGDASFRRYYRLKMQEANFKQLCEQAQLSPALSNFAGSVIVMDAPPETQKNVEFVRINTLLKSAGLLVPQILCKDIEQGFMVLEDLGDQSFFEVLKNAPILECYYQALRELLKVTCIPCNNELEQQLQARHAQITLPDAANLVPLYSQEQNAPHQRHELIAQIPPFDADFMRMELGIFTEWLLEKRLNLTLNAEEEHMLQQTFDFLIGECAKQPQVLMHRDFHSRNLMFTTEPLCAEVGDCASAITSLGRIAIIDYQDMVIGPLCYDLASLLRDCYIKLDDQTLNLMQSYAYNVLLQSGLLSSTTTYADFVRMLSICALQRHIKVLGIFNRLNLRDGKPGYLKDLPLVLEYVLHNCGLFPEMSDFKRFLEQKVVGKI